MRDEGRGNAIRFSAKIRTVPSSAEFQTRPISVPIFAKIV